MKPTLTPKLEEQIRQRVAAQAEAGMESVCGKQRAALLAELDAVRAELAIAIEQYDHMKDSRDAAKAERDEEARESARYLHDITKLKARYVTLLAAAEQIQHVFGRDGSMDLEDGALSGLYDAIQATERKEKP